MSREFTKKRYPRARKVYLCDSCGRPIPVGTRYQYIVGRYEFIFTAMRWCKKCATQYESIPELGGEGSN